ncbi:MAG: LysR family transcriptional regulator [Hyphomicrobiales bacterium]
MQLNIFLCVAEVSSITQASRFLNLSQPAITKQIKSLEVTLGLTLFDRRRGGPMKLTEDGRQFRRETEAAIAAYARIPEIADRVRLKSNRFLRIGVTWSIAGANELAMAIANTQKALPNLRITVETKHRQEVEESVLRNQCDLGLALLPAINRGLRVSKFASLCAMAVVAKDHALASKGKIERQDLQGETIILPAHQMFRSRLENNETWSDLQSNTQIECTSAISRCQLAANGLGVALSDPFSAKLFPLRTVAMPMSPAIPLEYGAMRADFSSGTRDVDVVMRELEKAFAT